eukprot:CAMPEP_0185270660 /NCGR_PEP_ID=MMETSP1359-20130426/42798_1 /TAXON_ID=552665 /ORGANISM="Bigelowiella longifila, Strain CCMP242" /LENGTH=190 /DNA_ID=CAMNT_0027862305 /DNA_START=86 /DNA_END=655 /DNA_ORIENTATION=-
MKALIHVLKTIKTRQNVSFKDPGAQADVRPLKATGSCSTIVCPAQVARLAAGKHGFFFRRIETEAKAFIFINGHSPTSHPNYRDDPSCMEAVYTGMKNPAPLESAQEGLYDIAIVASSQESRQQAVRRLERKMRAFEYSLQKYTGSLEQIIDGLKEREEEEEAREAQRMEREKEGRAEDAQRDEGAGGDN